MSEKTLLTVKEAAALVKLSIGAVYALCNSGTLPHHRLGQGRGAIRIDRVDLLRYVEECRPASRSPEEERLAGRQPRRCCGRAETADARLQAPAGGWAARSAASRRWADF